MDKQQQVSLSEIMAISCRLFVLLTTVFAILMMETGSVALQIDIKPEKCTASMETEVHLSCRPDAVNEDLLNEITLIKVSRNDEEEPIAFLSHCSNISYGTSMEKQFKAQGYIAKDFGQSYLNLTLHNPRSEDTGIYTCVMFYVDKTGDLKEEVTSGNLIVEKIDVKSLETVLNENGLRNKITTLDFILAELDVKSLETVLNDLRNKITSVESNGETKMKEMQEDLSYVSAFSVATDSGHVKFSNGDVLILPKVIMKLGQGYDEKTGVFTVPKDGLYTFHAAVMTDPNCAIHLSIDANDKVLGKLYACDKNDWDQSSISIYADLRAGDRVSTVIRYGSCQLYYEQHTMFSGCLIKAY